MKTAWAGAWACVASGFIALGWSARPARVATIPDVVEGGEVPMTRRDSSAPSIGDVASRDLFRANRRPATIAYDPQSALAPPPPAAPRPILVLVGLVAGDDPTAVIEGFPGVEGPRAVRVGDVVGGLTVRRISGSAVGIAGLDTVWVLKVRAWK